MANLSEETGRQIAGTAPTQGPFALLGTALAPFTLPAAGATETSTIVAVPAGTAYGVAHVFYALGAGASGGGAGITVLAGRTNTPETMFQLYAEPFGNGPTGGIAGAPGSVFAFKIPPGIKFIALVFYEANDLTHPGLVFADIDFS